MKTTMRTIIRTATTAARRPSYSALTKNCRPPGNTTTSPSRKLTKTKKAAGGCLLAAPSFLLTPTDSMIYDDDVDTTQTANLSNKASLTTSNALITSQDSLKDSFDAFLHSIEPLIHRRMSVGVSSIPHPAKIAKGGEDAYFLSADMKVMGVADGVGGWGDIGVDPALYSRSLMEGAKLSAETPLSPRDPVELMSDAYQYSACVQGSSTACIIVLDGTQIRAANLGDSGFMVIRGLEIVYRTKEQQHSFNFPYQIGTGSADKPQHSQRITIDVQPDDLIILGTDGLWDNLFDEDILEIVASSPSDPATISQLIARQAHIVANDKDIISPFSKSARSNGYPLATGGKLDDITVLCARVVLSYVDYGDLNSGIEPMTLAP